MKKFVTLLSLAAVMTCTAQSGAYADNMLTTGAKKVGTAVVWPFKKLGQGLKWCGNGIKHMFGK